MERKRISISPFYTNSTRTAQRQALMTKVRQQSQIYSVTNFRGGGEEERQLITSRNGYITTIGVPMLSTIIHERTYQERMFKVS